MFSKYFDHTILSANLTKNEIIKLCNEAKEYNFASVCVNPCYVKLCYEQLRNTDVNICTVVGFPLGSMTTESKLFETKEALKNGASEIDMVINIGKLKDKEYDYVKNEIKLLKDACGNKVLKVIIETCLLTDEEKIMACKLSKEAGADFVKTSTGMSKAGATKEDIELMRKAVGNELGIKASGGVRDLETVNCMIEAGATRIGSSSTVKIIKDYIELNK
ncbi:deoxyribose-phosphate aldolase [Candidatus Arthromitus sp. SFB-mouse-Japan]|uniref:deoxyribose-phosphate aldolase n=1 Tax=unclassified Candidatus Neoarthromitus TaxID=2638829 RepID=UPI00021B8061|nr:MULTISPECIES: deoxyribose-phosphate aldolase [unclassified Candidatus Arthromitus]EIA28301.1 Deoxyribose-phosphate aldolase [Candidatus Arthromitus sp. SFB-4]EIA28623.1 Deoxyribose-phosphate aldolase [Candidatus Arthromitus sp. SFB-co]EIA30712.1 Deoxyribose-phosphate aldolase [Candidatus Arthromitus sp. SFB-mouse-SU]EIA31416.1 Deoxyribose-phosphate aldolase [Candidatus Arthromitus sp. SFB-5]AID44611.1 Deoxyribose-phosphate aldolase [Candidatus Arthromitus sp. SFB-mouse-NL]